MSADAELSVKQVPLGELQDYERLAIEVLEGCTYDKEKHPNLTQDIRPLFFSQSLTHEWRLLSDGDDHLFSEHGWPTHRTAIDAFLSRSGADRPHQAFSVHEYNAQAEVPLVPDVDYLVNKPCKLPTWTHKGRQYFIVDCFSYRACVKTAPPDSLVNVITVNGKTMQETNDECQRFYNESMETRVRHLSIHCEAAMFVSAMLARSMLTFVYDLDLDTFTLKSASSSRLFVMYARDKKFIEEVKPTIMKYYLDLVPSTPFYLRHDNVTIEISATLLELAYVQANGQEKRKDALMLLHKYNLDVLNSKDLIKSCRLPLSTESGEIEERQLVFIDILGSDYTKNKNIFISLFEREPCAEFYSFMDEQ